MSWFGRGRRTQPDAAFPFLTADEGLRLRALVRQAFAESGREVTVYADHVVDAELGTFGLANIAALCHNDERGERAWPELTRDHVGRVLRSGAEPSPFETWPLERILASTYCRVIPAADAAPTMSYAREVAPGLVEVLNLDLPETVAFFHDAAVARFGLPDLRRAGLVNLRRVEPDAHTVVDGEHGAIDVVLGELFTASLVLLLPEVVARYAAPPEPDLGVFVAVPNRHQLAFHVLRGLEAVGSLTMLTTFALAGHGDGVGALTPAVYWWRPAEGFVQVSRTVGDQILIDGSQELMAVLNRLAARARADRDTDGGTG